MASTNRTVYRIWQFWQTLKAQSLGEEEMDEVATVLNPNERELFFRQDNSGRQHAFRVMRTLKEAGYKDDDLLAAALLHDVGKSEAQSKWWERPLVVLGQALLPEKSSKWATDDENGWQRPFFINANHPEWGAKAAARCGASSTTVALIRRHQEELDKAGEDEEDRLLALLQWADNQN